MRVIAGSAKGRPLLAPKGMDTRPITAKIKESLFNIWQGEIDGASFLDLFAGSGSMGIEAKSRGAARVVFVEKDMKAVEIIRRNLSACGFSTGCEVYREDVFRRIERLSSEGCKFDIIYLDPPFTVDEIFLPVLTALSTANLLTESGTIAIRARKEKELPDAIGSLTRYRTKDYGISTVHFYAIAP